MKETPRHGHAPIRIRYVRSRDKLRLIGDFCWCIEAGTRLLVLLIPGGNEERTVEVGRDWKWNGNTERPTLKPSLHAAGIWHGWIRDGFLVEM